MKKRTKIIIIISVAIVMTVAIALFMMTVCKSDTIVVDTSSNNSTTVYLDFFGSRIDLSNDDLIVEHIDRYEHAFRIDIGWTFQDKIDSIKKTAQNDENTYIVARVKCTGDLKQKINLSSDTEKGLLSLLYTEVPFEIVQVLEVIKGDENLLGPRQNIQARLELILYSDLYNFSYDYYSHLYQNGHYRTEEDLKKEFGFKLLSRGGKRAILPRVGYEYVIILKYYPEEDIFRVDLDTYACELSTPKDYATFRTNLGIKNNPENPTMPKIYWEILERYNIEIK